MSAADRDPPPPIDLARALRLFDETTAALAGQVQRLEEVLTHKQQELVATNARLSDVNRQLGDKVDQLDHLTSWLNLVMGAVASGVVAVDTEGCVTTCNDAACTALAADLPDPIGADYAEAFPGSPLLAVLGDGRAATYERQVRGRDGTRRTLSATASPVRAPDGRLLGAVEVFDDVTEVRQLRERAERADRLKQLGEMAAGVAHEIRNPLNGIEGFASLLARDLPADDRRHRYAQSIISGVRDLNHTVTGLLEFTKPRGIQRRAVDPLELARGVADLVQAEAASATVALRLIDRWSGGTVAIDGVQIRQVLINLVQNAVQAVAGRDGEDANDRRVGAQRRVELAVDGLGTGQVGVAFTVDDDGPGIPAAERQRIFTPFYTTKDHGTGLGLAVSHAIVGLHGGALTVDDSPLGGARFTVVLLG